MDKIIILECAAGLLQQVYGKEDISLADIPLIPLLKEYRDIVHSGEKKSYATYFLAEKYAVSERTIRRAVKRMGL